MNPKNGETFELRVLKPLHYQYFGWLSGARAWLHVLILAGAFRHAHSLDLIEIIAREDSPLFHDFEPRCADVCVNDCVAWPCVRLDVIERQLDSC